DADRAFTPAVAGVAIPLNTVAEESQVRRKPDPTSENARFSMKGRLQPDLNVAAYDKIIREVMKRALLVSTYDLGHQPFGLASPAAWLGREGLDVRCADLSKEKLPDAAATEADLIAFPLPMHTATRLAGPVIRKVRMLNPTARLCAYGLYAPLNEDWLRSLGVDDVLGGEFEEALAALAHGLPTAACVTS